MQLVHRSRSTVRRQLKKLELYGLVFSDGYGRWWRFHVHADGVALRNDITDPTPGKRQRHHRERRAWYRQQVATGRFVREREEGQEVYADAATGEVMWIDHAPPPEATAPSRRVQRKRIVPRGRTGKGSTN